MLLLLLFVVIVLLVSGMGWNLKRRHQPPPMDAGLLMRFALAPGERHGPVWQAFSPAGVPMMATITSTGVFALNFTEEQAHPVRLRPEGVVVTVGGMQTVTPGAVEPMLEVALAGPGQEPVRFAISQSGATAIAAWAVPSP